MSDPFIGEIRINSFNYAPTNWAMCNGQTLAIKQYTALYSLIGQYFGTDRTTNFNLPDLRGRAPVGYYTNPATIGGLSHYAMGQNGGTESVALTTPQMPSHAHEWQAVTTPGTTVNPSGAVYGQGSANIFAVAPSGANPPVVVLNPKIMGEEGGGQAHGNMQPYIVLNFCIALTGYYPSRQ